MLFTAASQEPVFSPFSTTLIFASVAVSLAFIYWYGYGRYQHFRKDGLKGPKPAPFLGSTLDLARSKWQLHLMLDVYYKKYGRVFGVYLNSSPAVVVSDPDMVKQILVKDFSKFHDRQTTFEFPSPQSSALPFVKGDRWKFIRSTLTPSLSSGKMRPMSGLMDKVADNMVACVKSKMEQDAIVDFVKVQQGATMEAILSAAFGVETKAQENENDEITQKAKELFRRPLWMVLVFILPFMFKFAKYIPGLLTWNVTPIVNVARPIIAYRKKGGSVRQDILQFMLEAQQTADKTGRVLTDDEIIAQCVTFLGAGYDTSSTTLALTCYHLSLYPEIQDKVYDELVKCWPEDNQLNYDVVQKMIYLDQVISETLRVFPPGFVVSRQCNEDCIISGTNFRNGYKVIIPVYSMHHDPEFWDDPEKFDPDRFSTKAKANRNPYVYLPFGHGPRNCIGMRFAQMEMKILLARLLKEFRLEVAKETEIPVKVLAEVTLRVTDPIKLRVVNRNSKEM